MAQYHDTLPGVRPAWQLQNDLVGIAADEDRIHASHELVVSMRLAAVGGQEVVFALAAGDKAIETGASEDGEFHRAFRSEAAASVSPFPRNLAPWSAVRRRIANLAMPIEPPRPGNHENDQHHPGPGDLRDAVWWRAEAV